ncbi:hypothetical protein GCM10027562_27330 [Arthrobacter pigmenti]
MHALSLVTQCWRTFDDWHQRRIRVPMLACRESQKWVIHKLNAGEREQAVTAVTSRYEYFRTAG